LKTIHTKNDIQNITKNLNPTKGCLILSWWEVHIQKKVKIKIKNLLFKKNLKIVANLFLKSPI